MSASIPSPGEGEAFPRGGDTGISVGRFGYLDVEMMLRPSEGRAAISNKKNLYGGRRSLGNYFNMLIGFRLFSGVVFGRLVGAFSDIWSGLREGAFSTSLLFVFRVNPALSAT